MPELAISILVELSAICSRAFIRGAEPEELGRDKLAVAMTASAFPTDRTLAANGASYPQVRAMAVGALDPQRFGGLLRQLFGFVGHHPPACRTVANPRSIAAGMVNLAGPSPAASPVPSRRMPHIEAPT